MKNHHGYPVSSLGFSDIAALTVTAYDSDGLTAHILPFGSDGSYRAYVVDAECEIPDHYKPVMEFTSSGWIRISDDVHVTFTRSFTNGLTIYRAGNFGCIIQVC